MIHVQNPEDPDKVFFISGSTVNPRGSALARIEIVLCAQDSAISFAWKRRIETFFPRTSTLILNENEPLAKSLCWR